MNCWTKAQTLKPQHYRAIGKLVINWCKKEIAYKKNKGLPKIIFRYNHRLTEDYAAYNGDENQIEIYTKTIVHNEHTVSFIIRAIIHEYVHYTQKLDNYKKLLLKFGYQNHPQEIEARKFENMWAKCYNQIKDELPKINSK